VVTATKFLFFACPEMPVFIYDSYVGKALKTPTLASKHYRSQWWEKCSGLQRMNPSALSLLRPEHRDEFANKEDWFTRRALDLMLYRIGHKLAEESKA
jgi:hypothetical protein